MIPTEQMNGSESNIPTAIDLKATEISVYHFEATLTIKRTTVTKCLKYH